jgi:hypothetical protein
MKKSLAVFLCICFLACKNDITYDNKDVSFFPIAGNINADLKELDSLPLGVNKYTTINDKTDTTTASKEELAAMAKQMITPDIGSPELKNFYKETVFYDNSSDFLTMSYTTESDKPVVRKIDVLIRQETSKLRSIYVEKLEQSNDSTINTRMVWTAGKSLQVITMTGHKGKEANSTVKYMWGME